MKTRTLRIVAVVLCVTTAFTLAGCRNSAEKDAADSHAAAETAVETAAAEDASEESYADTEQAILQASAPHVPATSGESTAGTMLRNIEYDSNGRIIRLVEIIDGEWVKWTYLYDNRGAFLYRTRNIGGVDGRYSKKTIPGTGGSKYIELYTPIENCVGFTLSFKVTKVISGDALGDRKMYISDGNSWDSVGRFSYKKIAAKSIDFTLEYPRTIVAFGTGRVDPDDSSFEISQALEDVIVADYDYVELLDEAGRPAVIVQDAEPAPGPDDLRGCDKDVTYPNGTWLPAYETKYVKTEHGNRAYLRYTPSKDSSYFGYVYERDEVTVLARQNGFSLVKVSDGVAGWVTSSVLVDHY